LETTAEAANGELETLLARLMDVRSRRVRPALDDKVITAWNGLALSAWSSAASAFGRPQDLALAQNLADFLLRRLRPEGKVMRSYRLGQARHPGGLDDHTALAEGLLDLYQVDFNPRWLTACLDLAETILRDFVDPRGGFYDTGSQPQGLPARPKALQDSPLPSGNALATSLLLRLEALTGESRYREAALEPLKSMQATAVRYPTAFASWLQNLGLAITPIPQLAIVGEMGDPAFQALSREAHKIFAPRLVMAGSRPGDPAAPALVHGKTALAGQATAYLCHGFVCKQPTTSPEELRRQLGEAI
jgi:uncharacterized protein YyaL (SSP411 family)